MSAEASPAQPPAVTPPRPRDAARGLPSQPALCRREWPSTPVLWGCIGALTLLGIFLRFWRLDHQAYWTDEAYTLSRIRDTYRYLLSNLSMEKQGFPPGWYTLMWCWRLVVAGQTGAAEAFQPQYMRMLPAMFGAGTVPAFYLLARQFTDRRGALLVMLLAAVNPFLIYYSRDIKMYACLWFFVVMNMGIFFHWLNTGRHLLCVPLLVLTAVGMTSVHVMAAMLLGVQLICLLTRRRPRGWEIPLWFVSAAAAAWIPYYWYFKYTTPDDWGARIDGSVDQGMYWIQQYTDMSWRTIASLPASHLLGFLWPVYPTDARLDNWFLLGGDDFIQHLSTRSWPWMANGQLIAIWGLFGILLLGLVPWRRFIGRRLPRLTPEEAATRGRWWWILLWIAIPTAFLALTWIPPESPWSERIWFFRSEPPKPLWEPRYLGIVAPAFLLWLGASLRRMPTMPLRIAAIALVAGVCAYSSLSNHLIYRNTPFHRHAAVLEKYITVENRYLTAVAVPEVKYPFPAQNMAVTMARHIAPGSGEDLMYVPFSERGGRSGSSNSTSWPIGLDTESEVRDWMQNVATSSRQIQVIVLTDRYGDITDEEDILSDQSLEKILGTRWKLVHTETYRWHYEWRFYIFHTWRTRVWVLDP